MVNLTTRKELLEAVKFAYQTIHMEYWIRLSERYLESMITLIPDDKLDEAYDRMLYHHKQVSRMQNEHV